MSLSTGPYSFYGRTRSWLGSKWHRAAFIGAEFTYCGMRLPLEVLDEAPPPQDRRCGQCDEIANEIKRLTVPR